MLTLSEKLEIAMEAAGIESISDLARQAGVTYTGLYVAMKRGRSLQRKTAECLAKVLNCDPQWLREGKPQKKSKRLGKTLKEATLCWGCRNAVPEGRYGCNWSRRLKPVSGWHAVPNKVYRGAEVGDIISWNVRECPEFIPDPEDPKGGVSEKTIKDPGGGIDKYGFIG